MNEPESRPASGELEYRYKKHGVTVNRVDFPERTIELVVMPYEKEAVVEYRGRMVTEVITRGAFNGIQRRKILANRDHDISKVVGQCIALHPNREEGLVAEVKVPDQYQLGTETLILANAGLLAGSAGFMPMADGEKWEGRNRRRITRAWLGHVAFVPDPAYEDAEVLDVRLAPSGSRTEASVVATPNLDQVRAWLLADVYASIDR